jgi:hypothetical protein
MMQCRFKDGYINIDFNELWSSNYLQMNHPINFNTLVITIIRIHKWQTVISDKVDYIKLRSCKKNDGNPFRHLHKIKSKSIMIKLNEIAGDTMTYG